MLFVSFIPHTNVIEYSIAISILIFICLFLEKYWEKFFFKRNISLYIFLFFVLYFVSALINGGIVNYVKDLLALLFLIVAFQLFDCYKIWNEGKVIWFGFMKIIIISVIVSSLLYNCGLKFLFIHQTVSDYSVAHIPFLGLIHYINNEGVSYCRPSWYLAEPSYLGFFLGIQTLLIYKYFQKKNRIWFYLFVIALLLTNSNTGFIAVIVSLIFNFLDRYKIVNKYILVLILPLMINAFAFWDTSELVMNNSRAKSSSLIDRQIRLGIAFNEIEAMNSKQLLFGKGKSFLDELDKGVSNAYLQMLLVSGIFFLVIYIVLLFVLFRYSCYEFYFVFIALNSTEIAFTSLVFLIGIVMYFNYQYSLGVERDISY